MKFLRLLSSAFVFVVLVLTSCTDNKHFYVAGNVAGADGTTIYLYREGLDSVIVCDSAKLGKNGSFRFKSVRPVSPDFYSVRIDSLSLWLAVDSTERITVNTDKTFSYCTLGGSQQSEDLQRWQRYIKLMDDSLMAAVKDSNATKDKVDKIVFGSIKAYKDTATNYIQHSASSLVSYYLLFKRVSFGLRPFEAVAPEDRRAYAMVANAWNKAYPNSVRALQLKETMEDMRKLRKAERFERATANTSKTGYIDLILPDVSGKMVSLSSKRGKHVLLQFCYLPHMSDEIMGALAQVYAQYKAKGLDVYMVTFDKNKELWKLAAEKLPWTVVLDEKQQSAYTYNFTQLPTNYFIAKNGNIVGKDVTLQEVVEFMEAQ